MEGMRANAIRPVTGNRVAPIQGPWRGLAPILTPLQKHLAAVAAEVARGGPAPQPRAPVPLSPLLGESTATLTQSPGKQLRPALLLVASLAGPGGRAALLEGSAPHRARRLHWAAVAFELLHLASLAHDDLVDRSPLRRGQPTVWGRWGPETAVLAGDYLYGRAVGAAALAGGCACRGLGRAAIALVDGQTRELEARGRPAGLRAYHAVITAKTAMLCAEVLVTGGRLGGAPAGAIRGLRRFGLELGRAYQSTDDLLDWQGQPDRTGKPGQWDLRQGNLNLPVLIGLRRRPARIGRLLAAMAEARPDPADGEGSVPPSSLLRRLAEELEGCGAFTECARRVDRHTGAALAALKALPPGMARDSLAALARTLVGRAG